MKRFLFWFSSILMSIILGLGSAYVALYLIVAGSDSVFSGNWATTKTTASKNAGAYVRTSVAVMGLLAMTREESVYYSTLLDNTGNPLNGSCTYELTGKDLPSRWWSITAYGMDHYFMKTGTGRYSVSKTSVQREADKSYRVTLSPEKHEGNWIATSKGDWFQLTARFYNPEQAVYDQPAKVELPEIRKVKCS